MACFEVLQAGPAKFSNSVDTFLPATNVPVIGSKSPYPIRCPVDGPSTPYIKVLATSGPINLLAASSKLRSVLPLNPRERPKCCIKLSNKSMKSEAKGKAAPPAALARANKYIIWPSRGKLARSSIVNICCIRYINMTEGSPERNHSGRLTIP